MKTLIELKNLEKVYGENEIETPALRGVSLKINEGEFVAIMGPSGSGKSTLLHILGFLDRPTKGEYFFKNRNIEKHGDEELAALRNKEAGFIFQMFNLLPRTNVLENVKLPLMYSDIPETKRSGLAQAVIESVGLTPRIQHETSQLSGGEKQRVAIARALINNPSMILADEPTGNLDSKSGGQVMGIIEDLHKQGRTILLVTHETYTAEFAERIIRLKDGQIESDEKVKNRHNSNSHFVK